MESQGDWILHSDSLHRNDNDDDEMRIFLQVKKTVVFKVKRSQTIRGIKSAFNDKAGVSENSQELFFNGDRLKDDDTVVDCGIQNGSTLHLLLQDPLLRVKLLIVIPFRKKSIEFEAMSYNTIRNVKYMIQCEEGIRPDRSTLVHAGEVLEDDRTIASLGGVANQLINLQLVLNPSSMLSFSVNVSSGDTVNLKVNVLYSVSDVKAIVGGLIGISFSDFDLIYQGKRLEDCKSLAYCNVQEGSVLKMTSSTFQIIVNAGSDSAITLYVQQSDTVGLVKENVLKKLSAPGYFRNYVFSGYDLTYRGKQLECWKALACFNVDGGSVLQMTSSPFQIFVKGFSCKAITLDVCHTDTIEVVKENLFRKLGKEYYIQHVLFGRRRLELHHYLAYYNIQKHDTLHMVF